jgi:hypothetical protein
MNPARAMTPSEHLLIRLRQLPEVRREAWAARFLAELDAEAAPASPVDASAAEGAHPLPGVARVPFARIAHLVGTGEGPGDLSTNPAHLDDFGRGAMR